MSVEELKLSPRAKLLVKRMLTAASGLSEPEVYDMIRRKKLDTGSLLNDEGACFLVASELGVSFLDENPVDMIKIRTLTPGMSDVSLVSRVLAVGPTREFRRNDGSKGRLRRILVGDETGTVQVIVWGEKTEDASVNGLREHDVVKLLHAYTRESLSGNVELHIGRVGQIQRTEPEAAEVALPPVEHYLQKFSELRRGSGMFHVRGFVEEVRTVKTFKRAEGEGRIVRVTLKDDTGRGEAVLWDEQAEKLLGVNVGDTLTIFNGKIKESKVGGLEVHADRTAHVTLVPSTAARGMATPPSTAPAVPGPIKKIRDLTPGEKGLVVEGVLLGEPEVRTVTLRDGSTAKVASVLIKDDTGETRLSAWRNHADTLVQLDQGSTIRLTNISTRMGVTGRVELVTRSSTTLTRSA